MENELRKLPAVDRLLGESRIKDLTAESGVPRELVADLVRENLSACRTLVMQGRAAFSDNELIENVCNQAAALVRPTLRPLINATGVILHTNLGRALLSEEAIAAMSTISAVYSNLEFDLTTGERGSRHTHLEPLICRLTGAEAAVVVNNNAAAVLVGLSALTRRKEVIVSRGQAVEIGGGFRIPDVMRQSGARLVEVGTTNCTYLRDYDEAITPRTSALLRVHSSNFRVVGFTHNAAIDEMAQLAREHSLLLLDDLGSGCPLDTTRFGLASEPTIQDSLSRGSDVVFFSGDKLLGGPQAGIIAGKKEYVDKVKKHPLVRAMRIDKARVAALAATLIHYLKNEAIQKVPVWQMISAPIGEIDRRATLWAAAMAGGASVIDGESVIGGGSLPGATLPTRLVAIGSGSTPGLATKFVRRLRLGDPPIIGRIADGVLLLDPRTVPPRHDEIVMRALKCL